MTEFQRYILENHPDPDSLLEIGDKFEQMCRLAEGYAQKQVKKLNIDIVVGQSEQLCQCEDAPTKHFIKNWCNDCKKNIV